MDRIEANEIAQFPPPPQPDEEAITCRATPVNIYRCAWPPEWLYGEYYVANIDLSWAFFTLGQSCLPELEGYAWHSHIYFYVLLRVDGGEPLYRGPYYPHDPYEALGERRFLVVQMPAWLEVGRHDIEMEVRSFCLYRRELDTWWVLTQNRSSVISHSFEVKETALLSCSFSVSETIGYAPLYVEFADTSWAPVTIPITSWLWEFGDGATSLIPNPTHVYNVPGTYTVKLTVISEAGKDSEEETIEVLAAEVRPVFLTDKCYFPTSIAAEEPFTPKLTIDNEGGPGEIYLNLLVEGGVVPIIGSVALAGYGEHEFGIGSHAIGWYLGYTPTASKYVNLTFTTGPVGEEATSQYTATISVIVTPDGVCTEGAFKCIGLDRYMCSGGTWQLYEKDSEACVEAAGAWLTYAVAGAVVLVSLGGIVFLVRRK